MKKILVMAIVLLTGGTFAGYSFPAHEPSGIVVQAEKNQIRPDDLPAPVKQTIAADETLKAYPVAEAWEIKTVGGRTTYKVGFDNGTADKLWKTYDPEGKEITE